jgi:integrase
MIEIDPLLVLKLAKVESTPHRRWTPADIEQYEKRHNPGTKARLALELILSSGQARCDVIRMGRQFVRDETLSMSRQKTGVPFDIPILPSLREELDRQPRSERHLTFLVTEQGKAFTAAGFGNCFRERCDERDCRSALPMASLRRCDTPRGSGRHRASADVMVWLAHTERGGALHHRGGSKTPIG